MQDLPIKSEEPAGEARDELMAMLAEARMMVARLEQRLGLLPARDIHPVAAWREVRGLTQRDLAHAVGVSGAALSRIEHKGGFAGRISTRKRIAEVLGVPEPWLEAPANFNEEASRRKSA
jgi:DNA-binding XRE family transcriptional regulator